jgi:hypothetical protein
MNSIVVSLGFFCFGSLEKKRGRLAKLLSYRTNWKARCQRMTSGKCHIRAVKPPILSPAAAEVAAGGAGANEK